MLIFLHPLNWYSYENLAKNLPDVRLDSEEEMEAEEGGHHDDVAADADGVAGLVGEQEELVNQPAKVIQNNSILKSF